jgi:GNAT superfamily N-acetyltransferase
MIRPAEIEDIAVIQSMIRELAAREEQTDTVVTEERDLHDVLFGQSPLAHAFVAVDEATDEVLGYTLWSPAYSTWRGIAVQVDDIYVRTSARGLGVERALLGEVAKATVARGYRLMQWWGMVEHVDNTAFYRTLGADYDHSLMIFRLPPASVAELAQQG